MSHRLVAIGNLQIGDAVFRATTSKTGWHGAAIIELGESMNRLRAIICTLGILCGIQGLANIVAAYHAASSIVQLLQATLIASGLVLGILSVHLSRDVSDLEYLRKLDILPNSESEGLVLQLTGMKPTYLSRRQIRKMLDMIAD